MKDIRLMRPGQKGQVINEYGLAEKPPTGWAFLPAGDAAITRKATAKGPIWRVQTKKGRRMQSLGIWAPKENIAEATKEVEALRKAPGYEKKKASATRSKNKKQLAYMADFEQAVANYLNFHEVHKNLESKMAKLVTEHAIPIGSGTVARTQMIPLEERAAKAVIAWMRHHTTHYDELKIARIKGERRKVRRQLAEGSVKILKRYRNQNEVSPTCPLFKALTRLKSKNE